ncbi:MAG: site-specific DNA-methyltransferase [Sphingomonas sp.]|nr:site-specific DNA-methyltransferase [Sphingomonas sp.]
MSNCKIERSLRLKIDYLPTAALLANKLNPKVHPDRQINALSRAISEMGFVSPIIVDQENRIVAGHGRVLAAKKLGLGEVPAVRLEHLNDHQLRALMLADNRLSELGSTNQQLLADNLKLLTVEGLDLDVEAATGFSMGEIDVILQTPVEGPDKDPDDEAAPRDQGPVVNRPGDVWNLGGRHRVICGNALEPDVWRQLMHGEKAAMSCSDFPYNVKIKGNVTRRSGVAEFAMASGEMDRDQFIEFETNVFRLIAAHSKPASIHFAFADWRHLLEMQTAGEAVFSELKNACIWDKGVGSLGSFYRSQHEVIFVWKLGRERSRNNIELGRHGRNRCNVWRYPGVGTFRHSDEGDLLALHCTPKPVRMIADAILDVSARGEIVIDAFLGSGTTIIAAERVGRRCFGVEIEPRFADTIIRRFERHSGERAVHLATGKTFTEVTAERLGSTQDAA